MSFDSEQKPSSEFIPGNPFRESNTTLSGWRLNLLHLVWVLVALFYIGTFIARLPVTYKLLPSLGLPGAGWTEADVRISLSQLGLTVHAYQIINATTDLVTSIAFICLGLFIFWRRQKDWMALLFSLFFITFPSTTTFDLLSHYNSNWKTVQLISDSLITILSTFILVLFPDGRFIPRWIRWMIWALAGVQIWRLFQPAAYQQVALVLQIPFFFSVIFSQIYRYRRISSPLQRQQTKWVIYGITLGFTPLLVYMIVVMIFPVLSKPGAFGFLFFLIGFLFWTFGLFILCFSFALAMLRSHLWDVDLVIRRTLIYGALTATLAVIYFAGVVSFQAFFHLLTGQEQSPLAIVISTLAIAVLFSPLRQRIQADIDRRFYRRKYNAEQTLNNFARTVRNEVELEQLTSHLLIIVEETMQPANIHLWLRDTPGKYNVPRDARQ